MPKCFTLNYQITEEDDEQFLSEVFSGCVKHRAVLRVVTEGFYVRDGRNVLRSSQNVYIGNIVFFTCFTSFRFPLHPHFM